MATEIYSPHFIVSMSLQVIYFSWKPSPSYFFKINFDSSMWKRSDLGGVISIIRSDISSLIADGAVMIYDATVSMAKLPTVWKRLYYAIYIFLSFTYLSKR